MEEDVKQVLQIIVQKRMEAKSKLEGLRFLEETNLKKSYQREIDEMLDKLNELDELYERILKTIDKPAPRKGSHK